MESSKSQQNLGNNESVRFSELWTRTHNPPPSGPGTDCDLPSPSQALPLNLVTVDSSRSIRRQFASSCLVCVHCISNILTCSAAETLSLSLFTLWKPLVSTESCPVKNCVRRTFCFSRIKTTHQFDSRARRSMRLHVCGTDKAVAGLQERASHTKRPVGRTRPRHAL